MNNLPTLDHEAERLSVDTLTSFFKKVIETDTVYKLINKSSGDVYCLACHSANNNLKSLENFTAFKVVFCESKQLKYNADILEIPISEKDNYLLPELVLSKIELYLQGQVEDTYETIKAREQKRSSILTELFAYKYKDEQDLLDYALNRSMELLDSEFGYIYKYSETKKQFTLNSWSKEVMPDCEVVNPQTCYELDKTGFWGEAVRQRKPLILNDFEAHNKLKKGYPEGHVTLKRFMTTPIFRDNEIIAVIGAANKKEPYTLKDVEDLQILMNGVWSMVQLSDSKLQLSKLKKAVEATDASVVITDIDGNIEYANPYFYKNSGYSQKEALGANPRVLKSGHHPKEFYQNLWNTIKSGKTWKGELLNKKKNGEYFWEQAVINPIININGLITNFIAVKTDISAAKKDEEEIKKRDKTIEFASHLAKVHPWEFNVDEGKIYLYSDFYKLLEDDRYKDLITPDELASFMHPDDRDWVMMGFKNAVDKGAPLNQKHRFLINGKEKWVTVAGEGFKNNNGRIDRVIGVVRDITQSEEIKHELLEKDSIIDASLHLASAYPWSYTIENDHFKFQNDAKAFFEEKFPDGYKKEFLYEKFYYKDRQFVIDAFEGSFKEQGFELEHRYLINNKLKWVKVQGTTLYKNGEAFMAIGVMQDVTKEKQKEKALADSEQFKSKVIEALGEGLVVQDVKDNIVMANPNAAEILGLQMNQLLGKDSYDPLWKASNSDGKELKPEEHPSVVARKTGKTVSNFIMNLQTGKGERRFIKINSVPIKNDVNEVIQTVTTFTDITNEKQSEAKVKAANKVLDFALEATGAALWDIDFEKDTTTVDDRWAAMLGYTRKELEPITLQTFIDLVHTDDIEKTLAMLNSYIEGKINKYSANFRMKTKQGDYKWIWGQAKALIRSKEGKALRLIGTNQNIDKLRKGEIALRKSEERYRSITEEINQVVWTADHNGSISFVNKAGKLFFKSEYDKLMGEGWLSIVHPDDIDNVVAVWSKAQVQKVNYENRFRMIIEGEVKWALATATPLLNNNGNIESWVGLALDYTNEYYAKKELKESEQKFRSLVESSSDIFFIIDIDQRIKFISKQIEEILGYKVEDVKGEKFELFIDKDDVNRALESFKVNLTGQATNINNLRLTHKNGTTIWFKANTRLVENNSENTFELHGVAINIDQVRENESLLKRSIERSETELSITNALNKVVSESELFERASEGLSKIFDGQGFITVNGYTHNRILKVHNLRGNAKALKRALKIMNIDFENYEIQLTEKFYKLIKKGDLIIHNSDDLGDLVEGRISNLIYGVAKSIFKGYTLYTMPLLVDNEPKGSFVIFIPKSPDQLDLSQLKTFSNLVSNTWQRILYYKNLENTTRKLEEAQQIAKMGSWEYDLASEKAIWSNETYNIVQWPLDQEPPSLQDHSAFMHPNDFEMWKQVVQIAILNKEEFAFRMRMLVDGKEKWIFNAGKPILDSNGEIIKFQGILQDIHKIVLQEQKLIETKTQLDLALEGAGLGLWDWNLETNKVTFDKRWCNMLGLKYEETKMELSTWQKRVHPVDIDQTLKDIDEYLDGGTDHYENIHRMKHANGRWVYIMDRGRVSERDNNGKPTRFTGTHLDITESKLLDQKLRQNQYFIEVAQDVAQIGSWRVELPNKLVWSDNAYKIFEQDPEKGTSIALFDSLVHPDDLQKMQQATEDALKTGNYSITYRIKAKSGI
ncbi:MAG: PAS domain-containing protein [Bacteroidia bacterium]